MCQTLFFNHFTYINSYNSHGNLQSLLSQFIDKETEVEIKNLTHKWKSTFKNQTESQLDS